MSFVPTIVDESFIDRMSLYRVPDKSGGLISACSKSVVVFAELMLGITLYSWQVDFLVRAQSKIDSGVGGSLSLALTSRQIGKSTSVAILSLWSCVFNKKPGTIHNNTSVLIVSRSDEQAKKLLREIRKIYRFGDKFMKDSYVGVDGKPLFGTLVNGEYTGFFSSLLSKDDPNNTTSISFSSHQSKHGDLLLYGSKSGSTIKCYPPTSVVLGETFSLGIVDEAGHDSIRDSFWFDELYPTGDSTDALWIFTSTPWKPSGFFYEYCDPDDEFGNDHVDKVCYTIDALKHEPSERAQKQYTNVLEKIARYNSSGRLDEVQRSYYCRFVKGDKSYFKPESIESLFESPYDMIESSDLRVDIGIDFGGKVASRSVITVSTLLPSGKIRRLYTKYYDVGKDDNLLDDLEFDIMVRFPNWQRLIPDDCPQGDYLIRKMVSKGWEVHPMSFRTWKVKKYGAFRAMLDKGLLESYTDPLLKIEMLSMEHETGKSQSVIMHAPGYTDDFIDSFVMSTFFFLSEDSDKLVFFGRGGVVFGQ